MQSIYLFSKTTHNDVIHVPTLSTHFFKKEILFEKYDAIVITSKTAIEALEKISPLWRKKKILTIAKMSQLLAEKYGVTLLQSSNGYANSLLEIIKKEYAHLSWLYPRPQRVASNFYIDAKASGIKIEDIIVYKSTCTDVITTKAITKNDILIFTSPFCVECFLAKHRFHKNQKVIAIGTTTAQAIDSDINVYIPEQTTLHACVVLAKSLINVREETQLKG